MFRYHDKRVRSHCKLTKPVCISKSIVNIQNTDFQFFLWCVLAHKYRVENHRERVLNDAKPFHELNQGDIQLPMRIKDISVFEQLNKLNIKVFDL